MIACVTVTGAIAVPVLVVLFAAFVQAHRWREQRNDAEYLLDKAWVRIARQGQMIRGGGASMFAWNWPQRLADKDSANSLAQPSDGCYSGGMQPAKEG